jgi:redox-sensitive bicupin YhaK (pirin superfamily)
VRIQQDARMFATLLGSAEAVQHDLRGRKAWLHVARGTAEVNGQRLQAGDGAALEGEPALSISSPDSGEVLLFDFPG